MTDIQDELREIRERAERAHEMTASDPARETRYSETVRLVKALEAVLGLADHYDERRGTALGRVSTAQAAASIRRRVTEALTTKEARQ